MADTPFAELGQRAQMNRLRPTAEEALARFGIVAARMRVLEHGFNTSYRIDTTDGRRFALRISIGNQYGVEHVIAETAWLAALSRDTDLWLPTPQLTRDGELLARLHQPHLGREVVAVLMSWLPGGDVGDHLTAAKLRATGKAMATLHRHGATWQMPPDGRFPKVAAPMMDVPVARVIEHSYFTDEQRSVLSEVVERCQHTLAPVFALPSQPIHADLHMWNTKWFRGRLSVFDFDDAGIGVPLQDLAIANYYFRDQVDFEEALIEGYVAEMPMVGYTPERYEALLAARNFLLLDTVFQSENAEFRSIIPRFVPNTIVKLRAWLDTGEYHHEVPGLIPAD